MGEGSECVGAWREAVCFVSQSEEFVLPGIFASSA